MKLGDKVWIVEPARMMESRWVTAERVCITEENSKVMTAVPSFSGNITEFQILDQDDVFASLDEADKEARRREQKIAPKTCSPHLSNGRL